MRARLFLLASAIAAPLACSTSPSSTGPGSVIVPNVVVPEDLIGEIASYRVEVFSSANGIGCDAATGAVTGNLAAATIIVQPTSSIDTNGDGGASSCSGGVTRCVKLSSVAYQTVPSVFSVIGLGTDGKTQVALGCAEATIDEATLTVNIALQRVIPKSTCGNDVVEPTETCDEAAPGTPACDRLTCQTIEELLSYGDTKTSHTSTGTVGQLKNPYLLWNPGTGGATDSAGVMMAVYTDVSSGSNQITARFMDDAMGPTSLYGPVVDSSSIYVPNGGKFPPIAAANDVKDPSAATIGTNDYVVFSSDPPGGTHDGFDIYYSSFSQATLDAVQLNCSVSTTKSMTSYTATFPSVAASGNSLLVAWQDSLGDVYARKVVPGSTGTCPTGSALGTQVLLGAGTSPKVASVGAGWAVTWQASNSVSVRLIGVSGAVSGALVTAGSGGAPSIASVPPHPTANFAVAWAGSGNAIHIQRYSSAGNPIATSDASVTLNSATTDAVSTPTIAGGSQDGGFYVVAWADTTRGTIMSRLVSASSGLLTDDSGFLFNTVDGTADDFQVNVATGRAPANPTVAVGGAGYIGYAWEDHGSTCSMNVATFPGTPCWGIVSRRFPLPPL